LAHSEAECGDRGLEVPRSGSFRSFD
jgi:hypothetical protein